MSIKHTYLPYLYRVSFFLGVLLIGCYSLSAKTAWSAPDSIGVEYQNGRKIIIHELEAKETYYGLSRRYQVPVKDIIAANNNKALKIGDTVRVPQEAVDVPAATTAVGDTTTAQQTEPVPVLAEGEYTAYKVGKGETLYTISKRFIISIESIKRANGLTSESVQAGTILKIPHEELPPPPPTVDEIIVHDADTASTGAELEIPANKYGIRELTEKGVGVWIDDLNQEGGSMLALHKTAPVGTVIKITNPMTRRTTFAKVVGKFADTADTKNAIIVISKSAASLIGVLDRRFQVEIAYGAPNESN
ncbi:DPBB and LysM peptidoglycan-binding domain-containing protein [Parapedobacter sp. 10938]|uniref:DPBB and LysM peptidoglycan-binding domain-containing protein n=1 Tax=Parapedobacter flavus TaxID=3110225 RepID=UPI002DBEF392|nr:LysM peptidoglycan-binding domain-containing protein [Parapedobacter sp. 10938]MEC3880352.1 LysM peptidoglycan-binding domain-containing protein [Parapedobacter sp. 10938]